MKRLVVGVPVWVWLVSLSLAGLQPLLHAWVAYFPPEGAAPTGLSMPDSATLLHAMAMFDNDFFSPYATCKAPNGPNDWHHFPLIYSWLYGALGFVGRRLALSDFMTLGIANGLFGLGYLIAVYVFFREVAPKYANLAFVLFALGGGPGGVGYILTGLLGLHESAQFDELFRRYAYEELFEGAVFSAVLRMPRLYYTGALAFCFAGLTLLIQSVERDSRGRLAGATACIFVGSFLHLVLCTLTVGLAGLYLYIERKTPLDRRVRAGFVFGAAVAVAWVPGYLLLSMRPAFVQSVMITIQTSLWLSCALSAGVFHLAVAPRQVVRAMRGLPSFGRYIAYGLVGYLVAFFVLFWLYQLYWGNMLVARDTAPAIKMSDWALLGVVPGLLFCMLGRGTGPHRDGGDEGGIQAWFALWLLLAFSASISAFGQGWFMRLAPLRAAPFIAPALCLLSAVGISRMKDSLPRFSKGLVVTMVGCGVCSILVGSFVFNGPLGWKPGGGPYAMAHSQLMTEADARLITHVTEGTVLASPEGAMKFGDVLPLNQRVSSIFGFAALDLSDQMYHEMQGRVETFFNPATPDADRRLFVEEWCVDFVYCPDTFPVSPEVMTQLRDSTWLEEVAREGNGAVFEVVPGGVVDL